MQLTDDMLDTPQLLTQARHLVHSSNTAFMVLQAGGMGAYAGGAGMGAGMGGYGGAAAGGMGAYGGGGAAMGGYGGGRGGGAAGAGGRGAGMSRQDRYQPY